jgi:hypothetical protein
MGQMKIFGDQKVSIQPLFMSDEDGKPILVCVMKATFVWTSGEIVLIEDKPLPVNVGGQYRGEPLKSSYLYEPETAPTKPSTDVVLIGHAYGRGKTHVNVRLRVGRLNKTARVTGDRYWFKTLGSISMTPPEPFESIPLIYERAFGGWDRSHPDPDNHTLEARNPVGTGFRSKHGKFKDGIRLPNIEDPMNLITGYGDTPPPVGFGFISPDWQPRASFAGTYDDKWMNERMPLLPLDFDRRFFNAASPGLVAPGYLKGDEPVSIENVSPHGTISFNLPGLPPPECRVQLTGKRDVRVETNLDTVIINTDENLLLLIWRGYIPVRNGPHDVVSIQIRVEGVSAPAAVR